RISDIEIPEVIKISPVGAFGLNVDLPLASEPVKIIDKTAPHKCLNRLIDVTDGNTQLKRSFQINVDIDLRNMRQKRCVYLRDLKSLTSRGDERLDIVSQQLSTAL